MSVNQMYHKQIKATLGKIGNVKTVGSSKKDGSVEGFRVTKAELDGGQVRSLAELTEQVPIAVNIKRSGANITVTIT